LKPPADLSSGAEHQSIYDPGLAFTGPTISYDIDPGIEDIRRRNRRFATGFFG
jgi:hypothetical protein